MISPVSALQTLTVRSSLPDSRSLPVGSQETQLTSPSCPTRVRGANAFGLLLEVVTAAGGDDDAFAPLPFVSVTSIASLMSTTNMRPSVEQVAKRYWFSGSVDCPDAGFLSLSRCDAVEVNTGHQSMSNTGPECRCHCRLNAPVSQSHRQTV
jgi:hypothetical protein